MYVSRKRKKRRSPLPHPRNSLLAAGVSPVPIMSPPSRILIKKSFLVRLIFLLVYFWSLPCPAVEVTKENLFQLATLALKDGEYEHAVEFFKKAIELDPKFIPAYNSLGIIYETSGLKDLKEAIRYFKLATEISPSSQESWNNLGRAYYSKGEFTQAERALLRSLELDPAQPEVEVSLGWIYLLGQSRGAEAISHFEKGGAYKDNPMVYYGMGLSYLIKGERFKVLDSITELRKRKREDLALRLEDMVKNKIKLSSQEGTPLITGLGAEHSALKEELKAMGRSDGDTDGIKVRLRGPIRY